MHTLNLRVHLLKVHDNRLIVAFGVTRAVITGVHDRPVRAGGVIEEDQGGVIENDLVVLIGEHDRGVQVVRFPSN